MHEKWMHQKGKRQKYWDVYSQQIHDTSKWALSNIIIGDVVEKHGNKKQSIVSS